MKDNYYNMKTFLYNTITQQRVGEIREGKYNVDGKPAILPPELIELEMVSLPEPSYDTNTHRREEKEYVDLVKRQWIKEYYLKALSQDEINARTAPSVPPMCNIKKFRLSLIKSGVSLAEITSRLTGLTDVVERETLLTEWEYSDNIKINSDLVNKISELFSLSKEKIDEIFILASKIE